MTKKFLFIFLFVAGLVSACMQERNNNFLNKKGLVSKVVQLTKTDNYDQVYWDESKNKLYSLKYNSDNKKIFLVSMSPTAAGKEKVIKVDRVIDYISKRRLEDTESAKYYLSKYDSEGFSGKLLLKEDIVFYSRGGYEEKESALYPGKVYRGKYKSSVWQMDIATGKSTKLIDSQETGYSSLIVEDVSPKGRYVLIMASRDESIEGSEAVKTCTAHFIYDAQKNNLYNIELLERAKGNYGHGYASWSPDGRKIAFFVPSDKYYGSDFAYGNIYIAYLNIEY